MEVLQPEDPPQIGGYPLLGRLGAGGMGRVYLARTPGGRPLALKTVLTEHTRDPGFRERFVRETHHADRVRSPWTVPVVDWSRAPHGAQWLATEYVPAPSLQEWVTRNGPLPSRVQQELAAELLRALAAVHAEGLIHRDLKPSNVLLGPQRPLLIDFGIARAVDDARLTSTGSVLGSPGYLAPEQVSGRTAVGPAADLFALAALLVFAATGHGPFTHPGELPSTHALLFRVVHEEPFLDGVPEELRPLLHHLLAKDPEDRPAAEHLAADQAGVPSQWAQLLPDELRAELRHRAAQAEALLAAAPGSAPPPGPPTATGAGPAAGPPTVTAAPGSSAPPQPVPAPAFPAPAVPSPAALEPAPVPGRARRRAPLRNALAVLLTALLATGGWLLFDNREGTPDPDRDSGRPSQEDGPDSEQHETAEDEAAESDADEDDDPYALPERWTGTWEGTGPGEPGMSSPFEVSLTLRSGTVGDVLGEQVSNITDDRAPSIELGCSETLKLAAVQGDKLYLKAMSAWNTGGHTWLDGGCPKGNSYTLTLSPSDPDTLLLDPGDHQLIGAPERLERQAD